ncbi:MAG: sulfatase [Verrucomicrobia bacterium]|nr:sulfatase [Verrucomicrobiota bacterium]
MKRTLSLLALFVTTTLALAADRKPNILLIISDDHGYGDVGAYGCKDIPTPHMDSLAKHGVRFTSGYVSGPYCSPTRAGLMTGRYQTRFGHEFNPGGATGAQPGLSQTETTLPHRLKAAGYKTGMVGKWHLGNDKEFHPLSRGFEEFFGFLGGAHSYVNGKAAGANPIMRGREPVEENQYLTDAFRREATAFIDRHEKEPWFLYLAFNAVHGPMDAAPRYLDRFPNHTGGRKTYATMLTALDDAVGAVLDKLRQQGVEEHTLVLFVADNGGPEAVNSSDNGPLRGAKAQTWEGGIRVPFMMQWKGTLPAGKVYDQPVIQLDFHTTAAVAAGIEIKPEWKLDGVDLVPFLKGSKTGTPHDALYWRFGQQMAIRMGDWKIVRANGAGTGQERAQLRRDVVEDLAGAHLYNLAKDIGETTNLAEKEPEKFKQLAAAWTEWNKGNIKPTWFPGAGGGAKKKAKAKQE